MKRKGAIELSANFIIVMVISIVIIAGGLSLFFKMKNNLVAYKDTLDAQTEQDIKQMMLSNSYHVAVYPSDPKIGAGDAVLVGVGITNIYTTSPDEQFELSITDIKYYQTSTSQGVSISSTAIGDYATIALPSTLTIPASSQAVKSVLVKLPKGAKKGQYIYTISINKIGSSNELYGAVQVYVTN
jgi:hypothetical protein